MSPSLKSQFLIESQARGFVHQSTDLEGLDQCMAAQPIVAYLGFDATADSLHVGSLVQIMWLRLLQRCGHKPIVLLGGGTTKVGDPSDKDGLRKLLDDETIDHNVQSIGDLFKRYLTFGEGPTDAILVNNNDWLSGLGYLEVLRKFGPHFTLNRMLTFESVKRRLDREQPLTFLEFNYMILQSIDFLELNQRFGCVLQMAGADQWGNIVSGADLTRRIKGSETFGITTPLITTSTGAKMGKTAQGAIWLNKEKLPVFDFWQYWRNTPDADVIRFLKLFTDLDLSEIEKLSALEGSQLNEAKKILANAATDITHGKDARIEAEQAAQKVFEEGQGSLEGLPTVKISSKDIMAEGISILDLFQHCGLTKSRGEGRRLIRGGGARLNDVSLADEEKQVTLQDFGDEKSLKLSSGRKRHIQVQLAQ
ncbi:MAG: tyrosine--tRNA ligase [bacterium]|nr:tyrosine--tRNA ligase [bacterium]